MQQQFRVSAGQSTDFTENFSDEFYHIFLFEGQGKVSVDFADYPFQGKTALFTSPYQNIRILSDEKIPIKNLSFHGDFYCIEYHKKEVACNGLLFNNIYLFPVFSPDEKSYAELQEIFQKIDGSDDQGQFTDAVSRSYLQLILAISSREKVKLLNEENFHTGEFDELKTFQNLVEENFITERSPSYYADLLHLSANALSKKIKAEYNKSPSQIIQERVILEAKKLIHLTRKPIKEIAAVLNFEDEYYFSRYFKKHTGVSPANFRSQVGISIVADL